MIKYKGSFDNWIRIQERLIEKHGLVRADKYLCEHDVNVDNMRLMLGPLNVKDEKDQESLEEE